MGWYKRIDQKYFKGKLPGGAEKQTDVGSISFSTPEQASKYTGKAPVVVTGKDSTPSQNIERANKISSGSSGSSSSGGSSGSSSSGKVTAATIEVVREGQPVSTQNIQPGDIPINNGKIQPGVKTNQPVIKSAYNTIIQPYNFVKGEINKDKEIIKMAATEVGSTEIKMGWLFGRPGGTPAREVVDTWSDTGKKYFGRTGEIIGGATELLTPTTVGDVAITAAGFKLFKIAPPIIKTTLSTGFTYIGGRTAFDPTKTTEERVAGGVIGGLGLFGTVFEALPYIRGAAAKFSPTYKKVIVAPEGFKAIDTGTTEIGLIERGSPMKTGATSDVDLPTVSQLKRGGFEVKPSEKELFLGPDQIVATSQQDFFKQGTDIALNREFFVTPQDPILGIPTARTSRLGLTDPFKPTPNAEISWGLPKQPQIGLESGAGVSRTGAGGTYKIGAGTELEGTKGAGTTIFDITKTGVTTIKGQRVDLFSFLTSKGTSGLVSPVKTFAATTLPTSKTSGFALISSVLFPKSTGSGIFSPTSSVSVTTTPPTITSFLVPPQSVPSPKPTISFAPTSRGGGSSPLPTRPTIPTIIPTPTTTKPSRRITPGTKIGTKKIILPSFSFSGTPSQKKQQGYIPQAKSGGKWITLSKQPMNRDAALSRMAKAIDNTTSAQGRIIPRKGVLSSERGGYFSQNQYKLRPVRLSRGRKIPMSNQFIEKRPFRIDSIGEKKGLKLAAFAKKQNWLVPTTKRKKKTKKKARKK